jgi:hypothetical protein
MVGAIRGDIGGTGGIITGGHAVKGGISCSMEGGIGNGVNGAITTGGIGGSVVVGIVGGAEGDIASSLATPSTSEALIGKKFASGNAGDPWSSCSDESPEPLGCGGPWLSWSLVWSASAGDC